MHKIKTLLRTNKFIRSAPEATVFEVAEVMTRARVGAVPILDGRRLVGIFSERDLMTRVVVPGRDPHGVRVREVMTADVTTASPDDRRSDCIDVMRTRGFRHLPVIEDGEVVAMLSMRDLLRDEIEEQDEEIRSLRAYLYQTPVA